MPVNYVPRPKDAMMTKVDLLLDTDVLIEVFRGNPQVRQWLNDLGGQIIGLSVLTRMEILQGARNGLEQKRLIAQLNDYPLVLLEPDDSKQALDWFESYHLSHGVGIMDCLIAASALHTKKPLWTFNIKHFQVFPGLNVQQPYLP